MNSLLRAHFLWRAFSKERFFINQRAFYVESTVYT